MIISRVSCFLCVDLHIFVALLSRAFHQSENYELLFEHVQLRDSRCLLVFFSFDHASCLSQITRCRGERFVLSNVFVHGFIH